MSTILNLNQKQIKKSVVSKLKALGYEVDDDTPIRQIRQIIKVIQYKNKVMADGIIGKQTMPLLGYSSDEMRKMLKLSKFKRTDDYHGKCPYWGYPYPFWLFWKL